jgi:hypothetical protein
MRKPCNYVTKPTLDRIERAEFLDATGASGKRMLADVRHRSLERAVAGSIEPETWGKWGVEDN